jgi:hypothetical protein
MRTGRNLFGGIAVACTAVLLSSGLARAADVTADRLLNPDKEPQNWLHQNQEYESTLF